MSHPTKTPPKHRFKVLSDAEVDAKRKKLQNKKTENADKRAESAF